MKKHFNFNFLLIALLATTLFSACKDDDKGDDPVTPTVTVQIPSSFSITDENFFPEDIVIGDNKLFVSGLGDGTLKSFDLTQTDPTATNFADAEDGFAQSWGVATNGTVLLNILNNPNFADLTDNGASKLVEYDIATKTKTKEYMLPSTISNSVQIVDGKYYVCEWSPTPRIMEIDPATGSVNENWFTSSEWDASISGLGGVIYNGTDAFYLSQGNKLWYLPVSNGTAGTLEEVTISGIDAVDADGITWDGNNTIYYATNDAGDPADNGTVYKVVLSDKTTATGSVLIDGLKDTSGVWFTSNDGKNYVLIIESQMGQLFGTSTLELPFNIRVQTL